MGIDVFGFFSVMHKIGLFSPKIETPWRTSLATTSAIPILNYNPQCDSADPQFDSADPQFNSAGNQATNRTMAGGSTRSSPSMEDA
jgi:hypothetical protein